MGFGDEGCLADGEPRPKRIRKAVERYGFETKNFISTECFVKSEGRRSSRGSRIQSRNTRKAKSKTSSRRRTRATVAEEETQENEERTLELTDLSEEVLLLILERVPAFGLINMSKTSSQFNRLCLLDTIWKRRCKVMFLEFL